MNTTPVALVIDDSPELRLVMTGILRHLGYTVLAARDGETGLALARDQQPDIVCLDLMLPTLCGLEVCEQLKRAPETADIPVMVVSARRFPQDRADAERVGANGFVTKPIDRAEFSAQVRSLLWQRQLAAGA